MHVSEEPTQPTEPTAEERERGRRNLRAVSWTSFLTDLSSEMVLNVLPLYMAGPLGLKANVIGLIEGVAEATASLLKVFSGWLSDRLRARKWLAVSGYGISALAKPLFYLAASALAVGAVRFLDRVGKGVRTAPRDALLADSTARHERGWAFGFHRAADTAGAVLGLGMAMAVVWYLQGAGDVLSRDAFLVIVLLSVVPALVAVAVLALLARDVPAAGPARPLPISWRGLGRRFTVFLGIVALFELGNSADAFIVLLASERGLPVIGVLAMLLTMNAVYAATSIPGGRLADRFGRRRVLVLGWSLYVLVYVGLGLARTGAQVWTLVAVYGLYYGLTQGTVRALVADLVPGELRATAYGTLSAVVGLLGVPASVIAGVLWHGLGGWGGFGPSAPFLFGAAMALLAVLALISWRPDRGGSGIVRR